MSGTDYTFEKKLILIVDDTPENLHLMGEVLREKYKVKVANSGEKALKIAKGEKAPDLILLDIMMPEMDGYEVCRRLKAHPATREIPVIFVTGKAEETDEKKGFDIGAVDYITKPISVPILISRVNTHLHLKATRDFLRDKNAFLEQEVESRTNEIRAIQDVTILALASLAETRDAETGHHIRRTQFYIKALANHMKGKPKYTTCLNDYNIEMIYKSAPLHDIGKVGIPDNVLLKPGKLTAEEFEIMKTHARIGRDAIENAENHLSIKVDFLKYSKEIAYYHHERWDGKGYPEGLCGEEIPISARLMAIADVYDALISKRVYKLGMGHQDAVDELVKGRGTHFDPDLLDGFLEIIEEIKSIAARFKDEWPSTL